MSGKHDTQQTLMDSVTRFEEPTGGDGESAACLVVLHGPDMGAQFTLDKDEVTIGRSSNADIGLTAPGVSRLHCRIDRSSDGFWIEDLESTNHTRVNEHVIQRQQLKDQDRVRLGQTALKFIAPNNPEASYHRQLKEASIRDSETGLYNRQHFQDRLATAADKASSNPQETGGGVLYLALDGPAGIRDQIGMAGVESLMAGIARRLTRELDPAHLAARFGEHSLVILAEALTGEQMHDLAERLRLAMGDKLFEIDEAEILASISVGVCPFSLRINDADTMLVCATRAAEQAQASGGNRSRSYQATVSAASADSDEQVMLGLLREAVDKGTLQTVFQPVVGADDDTVARYQLLPRLLTDDDQLVPAAKFVPLAEHHGVILSVDRWMSVRALSVIREHLGQARPISLLISQSAASLADATRYESLGRGLEPAIADPRLLVFDFGHNDLLTNLKKARQLLPRLGEMGFGVAVSGVDGERTCDQVLDQFAVDYIRLQPQFAQSVVHDQIPAEVFAGMVEKIHRASARIIVPQVEDAETMSRMWSRNADFLQGNFIQRPSANPDPY
jgi:multidomain signaling protein FimX